MIPAKFSTDRSRAATSRPSVALIAATAASAPSATSHCSPVTDTTSGATARTIPPWRMPTRLAASTRPSSTAAGPAGLASMSRSMPNSRSYTVDTAVEHPAEQRGHRNHAGEDVGLVGEAALQPGDRVVTGADQEQPHEGAGDAPRSRLVCRVVRVRSRATMP